MVKNLHFVDGCWQGSLAGELDVFQAPKLLSLMERALGEHTGSVVFDCRNLTYVDSMGLGALVKLNKQVTDAGAGGVRLLGLIPRVQKLFAITGLTKLFGIEENGHEA